MKKLIIGFTCFLALFILTSGSKPDHFTTQSRVPKFFTSPEQFNGLILRNQYPFINFDEGDSWTTAAGRYKIEKDAEFKLKLSNPYYWLHTQEYDEIKNGIAADGLPYWTYYNNRARLFSVHIIGTGSGGVHIQNMSDGFAWNPGDIALVTPGTYTSFPCAFQNLNGITIYNNDGLVTFSAREVDVDHNTNVTISGTQDSNNFYGFQFTGLKAQRFLYGGPQNNCTFDHIYSHDGNSIFLDPQDWGNLTYDGVNSNTKLAVHNVVMFCKLHKENQFFQNFRGSFGNVTDSCMYSNIIIDSLNGVEGIHADAFYRDTCAYWTINQGIVTTGTDEGFFLVTGVPIIHHCIRTGQNWGWLTRIFGQSLNTSSDALVYSNISQGNISYGFTEFRTDTTGNGAKYGGSPSLGNPRLQGVTIRVVNNTVGNMKNTSNYVTAVLLVYNLMIAANNAYAVNNLRYNSNNTNDGLPDSLNVVDFTSAGQGLVIRNLNRYFVNPITSNILNDTTTTWSIKTGASIIGIGNPNFTAFAPTDYNNLSWGATPDIGAVKFSSGPVAVAGPDQTLQAPVGFTTVNGAGSSDVSGTIVSYHWSQTSGPNTALFGTPNSVSTTISNLIPGIYIITLTVTDNNNLTASDQVQITILPAGSNLIQVQRMRVRTGP